MYAAQCTIYTTESEMVIKSEINVQYWHAYYEWKPIS